MAADPISSLSRPAAEQRAAKQSLVHAARQFEALFLQMFLRTMRESQLDEGLFGEEAGASTWDGMFDQMVSDSLAEQSPLGIADVLVNRWSQQNDGVSDEVSAAADATTREQAREIYRQAALPAAISSPFGSRRDPIDGTPRFHAGTDLAAPAGTPVRAVAPGTIQSVGQDGGYGLSVVVRHPDGWTSRYSHLDAATVSPGDQVPRGTRLGAVGTTGRATGPHLHFETRRNGAPIDPETAAPGPLGPQVLGNPADER